MSEPGDPPAAIPAPRAWRRALRVVLWLGLIHFTLNALLGAMLFHPRRDEDPAISRVGERALYTSEDSTRISSWWVPATHPRRRTVIYFHGNASIAADFAWWAGELARDGNDVLLAEYRGYGASEGEASTRGIEQDGDAALRYVLETRGVPASEVVVHGQSLGGAVAMHVLAGSGQRVAGGVIESAFSSLHAMTRAVLWLPLSYVVPDAYALDSVARAPSVRAPILQFHGDRDEVVPYAFGRDLHAAFTGTSAELVTIPGGHHGLPPEAIEAPLFAFLRARVP